VSVYQVQWLPGSDILRGVCHCGTEHLAEDPVQVWSWLLAHPEGHEPPANLPARPPANLPARRP
jgi:hypothetical protein